MHVIRHCSHHKWHWFHIHGRVRSRANDNISNTADDNITELEEVILPLRDYLFYKSCEKYFVVLAITNIVVMTTIIYLILSGGTRL